MTTHRCFCGILRRLKFRGVRCIVCRTECALAQGSETQRITEMAGWLAADYQHIPKEIAILLTAHTMNLVRIAQTP